MRLLRVVLLVLVLTACSSAAKDDRVGSAAPDSFADATCADLAGWAAAVQPAFNDLQSIATLDASDKAATQARLDQIGRELDAADTATAKLADGIDSRPPPEISSGAETKSTVVSALRQMRELAKTTRAEIAAFDINTATEEQATKLKSDIGSLSGQIANSLAVIAPLLTNNEQLRNALQNSASCQQAGSSLSNN